VKSLTFSPSALLRWPAMRLLAASTVVTVGGAWAAAPPPETSIAALAQSLGASVGGTVAPADVRWEPSRGALLDYLFGRRILYLASEAPRAPRDVYRARVRVSPEGSVLEVLSPRNLTTTPLGDDHALVMSGDRAAFATFSCGQEQSVTWLDLAGEHAAQGAADGGAIGHLTELLTRFDETGSGAGIERVDVSLTARAVGLTLGSRDLVMDVEAEEGKRAVVTLDADREEIVPASGGVHADVARHLPKRLVLWAVDTARAVPWIGPRPIAWLEEHVFSVRDSLRQLAYRMGGSSDASAKLADLKPAQDPATQPLAAALDGSLAGQDGVAWPPRPIASIWKTREPGEGEWVEPRLPWNAKRPPPGPETPPPPFYRTFVRPDEDRPYSHVILVAMDTRQLDLSMEAGTEDPKPLTGGHGPGRIPREPGLASRVVAAFNGGFKTEHGNYGMMVNKRILLPPQPNAATVVVLKDQRVGFGTWADTHDVTGIRGVADEDIMSFRQNLDPLVDGGEVNPMGRALWGYTLPGSGMQTERSGLCVTQSGQILYAWGDDLSGTAMGKALKMAGCTYAMHLDMNPHHTGFIFSKIVELKGHNYRSELLTPLMTVSPDRYIEYAPKDFFYVTTHDPVPPPLDGAVFHPDPGAQPSPVWDPAIWSTRLDPRDGPVDVTLIEAGRVRFRIRAGAKEPDAKTGATPLRELTDEDAHRVVLAMALGHAADKKPRGLATDGRIVYPLPTEPGAETELPEAALVVDAEGMLAIDRPQELTSLGTHMDFAELPLIVDDGVIVPLAKKASAPLSRAALGLTRDGRIVVASGTFGSDAPLAETLVRAGCRRVVLLDRGAHTAPLVQRVGTATPPRGRSEETALYVLSAPMSPRAFRFDTSPVVAQATRTR